MVADITTPFAVQTPDRLSPAEIVEQFVDHEACQKLTPPGHTLIQGPRGCGKSMLFRYMSPAAQCIARSLPFSELPFVGIIVPAKTANVQMAEMAMLSGAASRLIAENLLVTMVALQLCRSLQEVIKHVGTDSTLQRWTEIISGHVSRALTQAGYAETEDGVDGGGLDAAETNTQPSGILLGRIRKVLNNLAEVEAYAQAYINDLSFGTPCAYGKRFLSYRFFLFPLFEKLLEESGETTFYVLLDDADWLREEQTRVINTWVSFRTTDVVSFKLACQMDYRTFLTSGTRRIESPHDFNRVHLSSIYTHGMYYQWVKAVVERRLKQFGTMCAAEVFFPEDKKQLKRLEEIRGEIEAAEWSGPATERRRDDKYRYARPELIRRMGGVAKQRSKYLYCGFGQLVDVSNATIRFFLEAASEMYAKQRQSSGADFPHYISPAIQNEVVRSQADDLVHANFDEIIRDYGVERTGPELVRRVGQVRNLVEVMGAAFFASLTHPSKSERRVLAFALQTQPSDELQEILRLAVSLNFFSESALGRKEGVGRTRRYVLNRRIAPFFNLDPSGFSGYFWVTSEFLEKAIADPRKARDELRRRLPGVEEGAQMALPIIDQSKNDPFLDIEEIIDEEG